MYISFLWIFFFWLWLPRTPAPHALSSSFPFVIPPLDDSPINQCPTSPLLFDKYRDPVPGHVPYQEVLSVPSFSGISQPQFVPFQAISDRSQTDSTSHQVATKQDHRTGWSEGEVKILIKRNLGENSRTSEW